MLRLRDVRDLISSFAIADDEHCYCGLLDNKNDKSIGVYPLKSSRANAIPVGGLSNSSYEVKGISLLVHWNNSPTSTEDTAYSLFSRLSECKDVTVNEQSIKFIQLPYSEPISVGTDEGGVFEYVIECLIYYERR